jgi:hypothetical protein
VLDRGAKVQDGPRATVLSALAPRPQAPAPAASAAGAAA